MAENKTKPTSASVEDFINGVKDEQSKAALSLYITGDVRMHTASLEKLGKHKTGVGCIYINKLVDIDMKVLKEMIEAALKKGHFSR